MIYLVTEGALRITDSNVLDRGGMSSMDSGMVTSSGCVIFKKRQLASVLEIHLVEASGAHSYLLKQVSALH